MSSPTSAKNIEKGSEFYHVDDACAPLQTVCWPRACKELPNVCKYIAGEGHEGVENISEIPTGSLYFAATRGPVAELSARVTGSPYDVVGIVFQSGGNTYVYGVRNQSDSVGAVLLSSLMRDNTIIRHAILPIRDFDADPCEDNSPPQLCPTESIGKVHATPGEGAEAANDYADNFVAGETQGEGANYEIKGEKGHLVYGTPTPCVPEGYYTNEECGSYEDWVKLLRKYRAQVLSDLFKKYDGFSAEKDGYQRLAAIFGLPVSGEFRSKNQYTGPELVSLILFQAGLIWDNRFSLNGGNPYCSCKNPCAYKSLAEQAACASPTESFLILTTPANYDACCNIDTSCCVPSVSCDPCEGSKVEASTEEFDLRAQQFGFQATKGEKGEYFETKSCCKPVACYEPCDPCCPPPCPPPCPLPVFQKPCVKDVYTRTILFGSVRPVDLLLGMYRANGQDPDGNDLSCIEATPVGCGIDGELKSALCSLAAQRKAGDKLDYDLNPDINTTCWFGDRLIPVELNNNPNADNSGLIRAELEYLSTTVENLLASFTQQRMISQDDFMTGALQQKLAGLYSEYCCRLDALACETETYVNYNNACTPCCEPVACEVDYCCYRVPLSGCSSQVHVGCVPQPYYYGCNWSYQYNSNYVCTAEYDDLCCRLRALINDLKALKYRTPVNSILLSLVVHALKEAECLYEWLCACKPCPPPCPPVCDPCCPPACEPVCCDPCECDPCECPAPVDCNDNVGVTYSGYGPEKAIEEVVEATENLNVE